MLRSLYMAEQVEIIIQELDSISSTMPNFISELSTVEPFVQLFESDARFARFRSKPVDEPPNEPIDDNLTVLTDIGYELGEFKTRMILCGDTLRPLDELGRRIRAMQCVCLFISNLDNDVSEVDIKSCLAGEWRGTASCTG